MLNRRGHLPTFLLFFLTLILMAVAWFSFLSFSDDVSGKGEEVVALSYDFSFEKTYVAVLFEKSLERAIDEYSEGDFMSFVSSRFVEINNDVSNFSSVNGNYFGKVRNGEVVFGNNTVRIDDVFVYSESGFNRAESHFDLVAEFDESGVISVRREVS